MSYAKRHHRLVRRALAALLSLLVCAAGAADLPDHGFLQTYCSDCHDHDAHKGGLDLEALPWLPQDPDNAARWVKIHDRIANGEMPPPKKTQPAATERAALLAGLAARLTKAELAGRVGQGRSPLRRLSREEFEWSVRDLLAMPALRLKDTLPEDGKAHGFDRLAGALDFSSVHLQAYLAAVDRALDAALCPLPERPPVQTYRYRPWDLSRKEGKECEGWVGLSVQSCIGIGLAGMEQLEHFTAPTSFQVTDGDHRATALGLFRNEDADYRCSLDTIHPVLTGWHKLRVSAYSFGWDGKQVVPATRPGAISWGVYSRNEMYGTVGVPANTPAVAELTAWVQRGGGMTGGADDHLRVVLASCENVRDIGDQEKKLRGPPRPAPGLAIAWIEIEGPLYDQWPPASHRALFGDLPVAAWTPQSGVPKPVQQTWPQGNPWSFPKDPYGERGEKRPAVYVPSADPATDAPRLLQRFAHRAFRRPVGGSDLAPYLAIVTQRLAAGAAFQDAMLAAYRGVLTAPDFLLRREAAGRLDAHALATRLSYLLWSSLPDDELSALADRGELLKPAVLRAQTERLLADPRCARFVEHFLDMWLSLQAIAATQPDKKLYPEYMPWLGEAMLLESRAFLAELLKSDLPATNLVRSDFAMLNEPLAHHYGIPWTDSPGLTGFQVRKVVLPPGSHRGGFLTQAAVLKVTAAGTTTSPVKRGAFVLERLLGIVPDPPPPDAGAIEPDVQGATTVREQLAKHRRNDTCKACHAKIDGYGFALESFDVTGAWRSQYRAVGGAGADADRKVVNARLVEYHDGPAVDCAGTLADGRAFADVEALRDLLVADPERLARSFTEQLATYATGAPISFADRAVIAGILLRAKAKGYGLRTLLHEVVQSDLFLNK